ncbi:MAG TPA: hypothetical protein VGX23_00645 [Actinocrinis sp.]|nr:hypothetical protein [Actinocrinis sp.]
MSTVSARLAALGPFFAADSHDPDAGPAREPWRSAGELLDGPDPLDDSDPRAQRVHAVRGYLAAAGGLPSESIELRVAASVMHLGLAARTLSPVFGLAVLGIRLPPGAGPLSLRDLRWQPSLGSMFALSIPRLDQARQVRSVRDRQGSQGEQGGQLDQGQQGDQAGDRPEDDRRDLEQLSGELFAIANPFGVSGPVAGSNIASALHGARIALAAADPGLAPAAQAELDRILARPTFADAWRTRPDGRFQRHGCCLIYRAAPDRRGPLCGDCILTGT